MVTAGVYMVARFNFIYSGTEEIGLFIAYVGAISAILAAFIATRQDDIKKVLAYSTMSQLGYMFMAVGLGAYSAGIFHVFIHAFFKALLFMSAGAIIMSLHHEQDMNKMGALRAKMPLVFTFMFIATLAISGVPPFSGFFSKDAIITHAFSSGHYDIYAISVITAALTSYYMFRLIFRVFLSPSEKEHKDVIPTKKLMLFTLFILSIGASVAGFINLPAFFGGNENYSIWLNLPDVHYSLSHNTELVLLAVNLLAASSGIILAYFQYRNTLKDPSPSLFGKLCKNKFYVDEVLYAGFAMPIKKLSALIIILDEKIIDAFINSTARGYQKLCNYTDYVQNGNVRIYAVYMSVGIVTAFIYLWGVY
jgi:NADH-quinone oxidoreductase subunit L